METENNGMTRAAFLKGSAFAMLSVASAGLLSGCGGDTEKASTAAKGQPAKWSWETKPKPIPANEIKNKAAAAVVIIGAGMAGMCAAIAAKEAGAKDVIIIDKNETYAARGLHITGYNTKLQQQMGLDVDYRQNIRELVRWAQGRVKEDLVWLWARKCGACVDWVMDHAKSKGMTVGLWDGYYKGPDYTEYPVTHIFFDPKNPENNYNVGLVKNLMEIAKEKGVEIKFKMPAVQFIREGEGPVTGVIAGEKGNYTQFDASNGVIIATGDYASNEEMRKCYAEYSLIADSQIYFPNKCNTGDAHIMAMHIGGAMQKVEPHAAVIHLESGAVSYGFLHVNKLGERYKNEDVNTQSKSCTKAYQPEHIAWTVYDKNGLRYVKSQMDAGQGGGLFFGQMAQIIGNQFDLELEEKTLQEHIKDGKVVTADSLEELAKKMEVPADALKKTVERYNQMVSSGNDVDYGKRKDLLTPVLEPPFYAGKLLATILTMVGGLSTDLSCRVLDAKDKPIERLYVAGSAAGDFFAGDYPTINPGIGHSRCITFGRLVGTIAAGGAIDKIPSLDI